MEAPEPTKEERILKQGVLDLSNYEFDETSEVELKGEWEFYYDTFLFPPIAEEIKASQYLNVPRSWEGFELNGKVLPRTGFVTFRGVILLPAQSLGKELRLFVPDIASAYRLYINGVLSGNQGEPSEKKETDIAKLQPKYYSLIPKTDRLEIIFHISNYQNNNGGFWDNLVLGSREALENIKMTSTAKELFLLGAILIIGMYHSGLYFYRRKEKSIFYFALMCLFLGIRIACTGNRYIFEFFDNISWEVVFRLEFFAYYSAVAVFILFIGELFPLDSNKKIIQSIVYSVIIYDFTLLLPISIYTILLYGFQFIAFFAIGYVLLINGKAVYNKRPNSKVFLTGLIILASFVIHDIIRHTFNDRGTSLTPYGLLVFIFFQSLILSSRIASAFTRAEELSESLKISNESLVALTENLESNVLDRTSLLNTTLQRLKRDLQLAKKIQQKILPTPDFKLPNIEFYLHFQPQDEIGGDFYDIFEFDNGTVRFFLADATGHGIQAALYTMAIKSEYEAIKKFVTKTDDLISHLNQKVQNKFSGLKIVFSCIIIDIDTITNKMYYTSAGHPDQILLTKKTGIELLPRTGNIIGLRKEQEYTQYSTFFEPGDRIFLFTDGIVEQKNPKREEYGLEKIIKRMSDYRDETPESFMKDIIQDLNEFQDTVVQEDDLTLLLIEFK